MIFVLNMVSQLEYFRGAKICRSQSKDYILFNR